MATRSYYQSVVRRRAARTLQVALDLARKPSDSAARAADAKGKSKNSKN